MQPDAPAKSWPAFVHNGVRYELNHLDSFEHVYEKPAQGDKPAVEYRVFVYFSDHCFTERQKPGDDPLLKYPHSPPAKPRTFDVARYELSKKLPDLVRNLMGRKCFHTYHGNYFIIEITTHEGVRVEYEVYFKPYREQSDRQLRLVIESAFPRDPDKLASREDLSPVKFDFLIHNAQSGKATKRPQRR